MLLLSSRLREFVMETNSHSLKTLFQKMGLQNGHVEIERFVAKHSLSESEELTGARFWTSDQRAFLERAHKPHSHWIEQIEILEARLRQDRSVSEPL